LGEVLNEIGNVKWFRVGIADEIMKVSDGVYLIRLNYI
jgi:hypothetical protein